jgi:hypothetical protein
VTLSRAATGTCPSPGHHSDGIPFDGHHRQLPRVDAGDVDDVADQAIHARDVPPDTGGGGRDVRLRLVVSRLQQRQAEDDSVEEVADVVSDHPQEVVAVRDGVVRTVALGEEIRIGSRPLVHQQGGQRVRLSLRSV